jgi:hypothetical protein
MTHIGRKMMLGTVLGKQMWVGQNDGQHKGFAGHMRIAIHAESEC